MSPKYEKVSTIKKTYRKLWSLAHKFSNHNSKITTEMERFIKDNYLDETFTLETTDGTQKTLPMFVTGKPRKGGQSVYFDPRATEEFTLRHKDELAQKAIELEEKSEFISLRNFARSLKLYSESNEILENYIQKNALDDTFETTDENGNPQTLNIFEYPTNKMNKTYLSIRKDGVPTFLKNHRERLQGLGVILDEYTNDVLTRPDDSLYTPRELSELLQIRNLGPAAQNKFYHLIENNFSQINKKDYKTGAVRPLFQKRWYRKLIHCLPKEDMHAFVFKAQKQLKKLGVPQSVLNHYLFKETLQEKTEEMVSISQFVRSHLHTTRSAEISKEIIKNHLKDTYIKHHENGKIEEKPIFIKIANSFNAVGNYVFASKEAMYAFAKKNKELLVQGGTSDYRYQNLIDEENATPIPQGEAFSANELVEKHIINAEYMTQLFNYTNETFTSFTRHGAVVHLPLVYTSRDEKSGHLKCHVLKEGLKELLTRHKKDLHVQDGVIDAIELNKDIRSKEEQMVSMGELLKLMGRREHVAPKLKELIKKTCIHDTFTTSDGTEKEIFSLAHTKNGQIALFIEAEAIPAFLTRQTAMLATLDITSKHIHTVLHTIKSNPNFVKDLNQKRKDNLIIRKQREMKTKDI